jgi:hypothetical protein
MGQVGFWPKTLPRVESHSQVSRLWTIVKPAYVAPPVSGIPMRERGGFSRYKLNATSCVQ